MDAVEKLIRQIDDLPTLPAVALRVARDLQSRECSLAKLAREIELDYALAARVLRVANSAIFGSGAPAASVQAAVTRLGTRRTAEVVLTVAVIEALPSHRAPLDLSRFWCFSLGSAILARRLGTDLDDAEPDCAYLAGLLHSIGEAVLAIYFSSRYAAAWDRAATGEKELDEALAKEFGVLHPEVGARLLQHWHLPLAISEAVEWHLDPESAPSHRMLAAIVFAADRLCRVAGLGPSFCMQGERDWLERCPRILEERLRARGIDGVRAYLGGEAALLQEVAEFARGIFGGGSR